jgi:hypothetical protein
MKRRRSLAFDLALGTIAGVAGTYLMDRVTTLAYDRESKEARTREDEARKGRTAYEIAAEKLDAALGTGLDEDARKQLGTAIHWVLGMLAGTFYGALRNSSRDVSTGSGVLYGLVFWLLVDEGALTLLGLTPPPDAFPWQAHARGLAGHLTLGAVCELPFDLADAIE